jgi:hypothetical protein
MEESDLLEKLRRREPQINAEAVESMTAVVVQQPSL